MISNARQRLRRRVLRIMRRWPTARARPANEDYAIVVPFSAVEGPKKALRLAVVAHIFFVDLVGEMRRYLKHIARPCDLLITTDDMGKKQAIEQEFSGWEYGKVRVRLVSNRGRDIAPKLTAFSSDYDQYDLILFVHTKKSETVEWGDDWRKQIMASLCGSQVVVASILELFDKNSELGMLAPKNFERLHSSISWGDSKSARQLAETMNIELHFHSILDFPAGSMFWARPAALHPMLDLGLKSESFAAEAGQTGDTLAHAIERLFFVSCELAGLYWCKVVPREHDEDYEGVIEISDAADLAEHPAIQSMALRGAMYRNPGAHHG